MKILKCLMIQVIILFIFASIFSPDNICIDDNKNMDNKITNSQLQEVPIIAANPIVDNINNPSTRSRSCRNSWIDNFDDETIYIGIHMIIRPL